MTKDILKRFQCIDALIQKEETGTPEDLAQKIGLSKRTIYYYLDLMKKLGAPIAYNILTKSYYYKEDGCFVCAFSFGADNDNSKKAKPIVPVKSMKEYIEKLHAT